MLLNFVGARETATISTKEKSKQPHKTSIGYSISNYFRERIADFVLCLWLGHCNDSEGIQVMVKHNEYV